MAESSEHTTAIITGTNASGFRSPPESYVFDNLIADFSNAITKEELKDLKQRFKNVQHVESPQEMFEYLRDQKFIGPYNILYIQQIVRNLERKELVEKLERYVTMFEEDKVMHFFPETTVTAEGYSMIKYHIKGHGISETSQLEEFRREVARLLICPLQEVNINGIQETNSTILTLMIPTMYVDFLAERLKKHNQRIIRSFMELNVDTVTFNNNELKLQMEGKFYTAKKESREHGEDKFAEKENNTAQRDTNKQQTTNAQTVMKIERISREKNGIVTKGHRRSMSPPRQIQILV